MLIVGNRVSSVDIARFLEGIAAKVYISSRNPMETPIKVLQLIWSCVPDSVIFKKDISRFANKDGQVDGSITFVDGTVESDIDNVIFCTGFAVDFPFLGGLRQQGQNKEKLEKLRPPALLRVPGKRTKDTIKDTYRDIFCCRDPTLALVGFPGYIPTLATYYYQAQAVGRVWGGSAMLPNEKQMIEFAEKDVPPCVPFDFEGRSLRLHTLRIVTWLNSHAAMLAPDLPPYKGFEREVSTDLWGQVHATFKERTDAHIRATKEKRLKELRNLQIEA